MKRLITLIPLLLIVFFQLKAQEQKQESKPKLNLISVSGGISGHVNDIYKLSSPNLWTDATTVSQSPALKLFYERNITNLFKSCYLGIGLEYSQRKTNITSTDGSQYFSMYTYTGNVEARTTYFAPRISFNIVFPHPKWRVYCNLNVGLFKYDINGSDSFTYYDYYGNYDHSDYNSYSKKKSAIKTQVYAGIRGFIFNYVGIFAEVGYGISYLNAGLNLRF